ncbi:MAG: dihydroorotate dehydrogenase-like protein [Kiritimatiellales bacterium]
MNLKTTYMGLNLKNPIIVASSPISQNLDDLRKAADAGAAAAVMFSLFAEQLGPLGETPYLPDVYVCDPEAYLNLVQRAVEQTGIPILGSLNGVTNEGWVEYAKEIEQTGVAGLELNIYHVAADPKETGAEIEKRHLDILKAVKSAVTIPVAMKISPYFSSLGNMAKQFDDAGADALVLFNRFYQPDFDLEAMEVEATLDFSTSAEIRLPLRWIAMLHGKLKASLAASIGVQNGAEVIKYLLAGADAVMTASALIKNGPGYVGSLIEELQEWMKQKEYDSLTPLKGAMSQRAVPNPGEFERANYIKVLETYRRKQA